MSPKRSFDAVVTTVIRTRPNVKQPEGKHCILSVHLRMHAGVYLMHIYNEAVYISIID